MKTRQAEDLLRRLDSPDWRIREDAKNELDEDIAQGNADDQSSGVGDDTQLDYE